MESNTALDARVDSRLYEESVKKHTREHAGKKTRAALRKEYEK